MNYKKEGKPSFRLSEVAHNKGKRHTSLLSPLLLLILGLANTPAFAKPETMTQESVEAAVSHAYKQEIAHIATMRNWPDYQLHADIRVPPSVTHLPACQSDLVIEGRDGQSLPVGNLRRTVSCNDADNVWQVNVSLKTSLTLPVVVTQHSLQRGDTVTAMALTVEPRTLTRDEPFFTSVADATDHQAERRVRTGRVLNPDTLIAIPLVEKGNEVVLVASKDGFSASTRGIALESGKKGEQIEVRNLSSDKVVRAVVTGLNRVNTQF